ncbi:MAG: hypothetical protein MZV64_10130 [Ignavibacteriales bacterium]|nr:hypothetical protein [Ignavibacteriales bacterium]
MRPAPPAAVRSEPGRDPDRRWPDAAARAGRGSGAQWPAPRQREPGRRDHRARPVRRRGPRRPSVR